jgi:DNA-binding transcriptional ArsR family regulator
MVSKAPTFDFKGMMGARADQAADLLKLLAHPMRLRILCLLGEGEKSVGELVDACDLPQPSVSQILSTLRANEIVACRREGTFMHYRIADERVLEVIQALKQVFCGEVAKAKSGRRN